LWKLPLRSSTWVVDQYTSFCQQMAIKEALLASAADHKNQRYDPIVPRMQEALKVGTDFSELGTRFTDFDARKSWYSNRERIQRVVPTGWAPIDHAMRGGLGAGELGMLMGGPKSGKSFGLVNLAVFPLTISAAHARDDTGLKGLYISNELRKQKVFERIDKLHAGKEWQLIENDPKKFMERVKVTHRRFLHKDSELVVEWFPNKSLKPSMLDRYVESVADKYGWEPDYIVVDYLDEMAPERADEHRFELGSIASDLRAIAGNWLCPLWTATQTRRSAINKEVVTMDDVAEDISKIRVADAVITICMTQEEYAEKRMRYFMAAMRDAAMNLTFDMEFDFARSLVRCVGRRDPVPVVKAEDKSRQDEQLDRMLSRRNSNKGPSRVDRKE
jgi:KaiC/GvpD/RAD55 family RecA-like ATPase